MRILTILLALLIATSASADYLLKINIPSGASLDRLALLCDWLRADPKLRKPNMTNKECGTRLFLRGAFELNHDKRLQELRADSRAALAGEDAAFWGDLPKPAIGPPPSPTAAPTVSPTVTPTISPTISPTVPPTASPTPAP